MYINEFHCTLIVVLSSFCICCCALPEQGEPWLAVLQGHELDPAKQQEDQQRLLLERFQREVRFEIALAALKISCSVCWQ
jgi:hypothetical protein